MQFAQIRNHSTLICLYGIVFLLLNNFVPTAQFAFKRTSARAISPAEYRLLIRDRLFPILRRGGEITLEDELFDGNAKKAKSCSLYCTYKCDLGCVRTCYTKC
ncbi:unnamed protein product [Calicophoron daubneyi]|uniref:Uncharacterized protein n=1 Tax=Calicophoron daubneyi TaxID=300641 RepID=A0AAV2TWH2_CALDB